MPGVNHLQNNGRWAFADVYRIEAHFKARIEAEFDQTVGRFIWQGR